MYVCIYVCVYMCVPHKLIYMCILLLYEQGGKGKGAARSVLCMYIYIYTCTRMYYKLIYMCVHFVVVWAGRQGQRRSTLATLPRAQACDAAQNAHPLVHKGTRFGPIKTHTTVLKRHTQSIQSRPVIPHTKLTLWACKAAHNAHRMCSLTLERVLYTHRL